jgi:Ca-activated chloride channel family protein
MKQKTPWGVLCLIAPLVCSAQTPFRVDVQLINIGFSVRDAQGKLIPYLTKDDFEVFEDGVPQKVSFFARSVDVPLNLGLVVDISGSQGAFIKQHRKDVRTFLTEVLGPLDRAFLLCFANHPRLITEYKSSAKYLVDALQGFEDARNKNIYPMLGPIEIRTAGTAFYDALYHTANQMMANTEMGRKAILVFSDGEDNASAHHMMDAIEIAQSNNVLLFCLRYTDLRDGRWTARNKYGAGVMERLARETGGGDFDATEKGLAENFRLIGEQLRSAYELGYHSTNPDRDGTFRKLRIHVKRPGLIVRAKTGYYARP